MELKEGMYVRTKDGNIFECSVGEQMGKPIYYPKNSKTNGFIDYDEICNSSKDLIDLIEEGDYVNECLVIEKPYCYHDVYFVSINSRESWGWGIGEMPITEIKSIVTKEMFDSVKYEVE